MVQGRQRAEHDKKKSGKNINFEGMEEKIRQINGNLIVPDHPLSLLLKVMEQDLISGTHR